MRLPQVPRIPEALPVLLVGFIVSPQFVAVPPPVKVPVAVALGVLVVVGLGKELLEGENLKQTNIQNRQQKKKSTAIPDGQWPVGMYDPEGRNNVGLTLSGSYWTNGYPQRCSTAPGVNDSDFFSMVGDGGGIEWVNTEPSDWVGCPFKTVTGITAKPANSGIPDGEGGGGVAQVGLGRNVVVPYTLETSIYPQEQSERVIPFPEQIPEIVGFGTWLEPEPARLPQRRTLPQPDFAPQEPEVLPDYTPVKTPGIKPPKAPPIVKPKPKITPKAPPDFQPTLPDGTPQPKPKPDIQTTPEWQEIPWPNAEPIGNPAQQPRPDPVGVAQMLGKLEEKAAKVGGNTSPNPPAGSDSIMSLLAKLIDFLGTVDPGTDYTLYSPCVPEYEPGNIYSPLVRTVPPVVGGISALKNRVDALAGLLQDSKLLPQPVCAGTPKPLPTGEWVSVNFEGLAPSPAGDKPLRKILRYRDQSYQPLEAHAAHWHHFEWEAGPVCVIHKGLAWGVPQVWAATAEEGKRVLGHAALVAGVDLNDPNGQWIVTHSDSPRVGQPSRMAIRRLRNGALMVSKRNGSNGLAEYAVPT